MANMAGKSLISDDFPCERNLHPRKPVPRGLVGELYVGGVGSPISKRVWPVANGLPWRYGLWEVIYGGSKPAREGGGQPAIQPA